MTTKIPLLDQLDEARAATPGPVLPWHVDPLDTHRIATRLGGGVCSTYLPGDAALIVAAVNALPQLVAAARRVLDLADQLETDGMREVKPWMIARLLRVAVTDDLRSALSPEASR